MRLLFGHDDMVAQWVSGKIGALISPPYVAIGATRDEQTLCAGVVFNDYSGHNIEITLASEGKLTRGAIRGIYHYAFAQVGAGRVTARARRSNKVMRELLPRFGFIPDCGGQPMKNYYGPNKADDAFVFVLFPQNARKFYG